MENLSQETIAIIIIAALIALVVGFILGRISKGEGSHTKAALSDAQKELEDYKQEVSEHFGKTADLVDNLTQSYKDVFDHLGSSAKTLLNEEQVNKHITSRANKAITLTYAGEAANKVIEIAEDVDSTTVDTKDETPKGEALQPVEQALNEAEPNEGNTNVKEKA